MRRVLLLLALLALCQRAEARQKFQGSCQPINSAVRVVSCTVTVYQTGTFILATLYSDNAGTPKANPFTADANGNYFFYSDNGRVDVTLSGGSPSISPAYTLSDILLYDLETTGDPPATVNVSIVPYAASTLNLGSALLPFANIYTTNLGVSAITGPLTLTGNLAVTGNESVGGTFAVTGAATLPIITGPTSLTGNLTVSGTLGVTGATSLGALSVSGGLSLTGPTSNWTEISTPGGAPPSGTLDVYAKTGDEFCVLNNSDTETCFSAAGSGITSLNGLTGTAQTFATATTGTDFSISSAGTTHTFAIPTASSTVRGLLSSSNWSTFNGKQAALTVDPPLSLVGATLSCPTCVSAAQFDATAQMADVSAATMLTPSANGFYRFDCWLVTSQAATSSSTLPACEVGFTDADSSTAQVVAATSTSTANAVGTYLQGSDAFYAKSGVAINVSTSGYATSGATVMLFAIHARLSGPY